MNLAPAYHAPILIEIVAWRLVTSSYFCRNRRIPLTINRGSEYLENSGENKGSERQADVADGFAPVSNGGQEAKLFLNPRIYHPTVCVPEIVHVYSRRRGRILPGTLP